MVIQLEATMGILRTARSILFVFLIFTAGFLQAAPPEANISLICVTEFPSTTFEANQIGDEVHMRVIHHNGAKYAPFHNTLVTPNDIEFLKRRAQVIEKLGDQWNFKWRRSGCNADTPLFFQCVGEAHDFEINGIKIHPWSITVSDVEEKSTWGKFKSKNIRLNFSIEQQSYYVTMNYQPNECVELGKLSYKKDLKSEPKSLR